MEDSQEDVPCQAKKLPVPSRNNLVERREFLSGAATLAGASLVGGAGSSLLETTANAAPLPEPAPPSMTPNVERKLARWQDQRWLLDAVIASLGPEWDQGRLGGLTNIPGGAADAAGLRARIHKFNDISREFTRAAVRREREAKQYEKDGRTIPAREAYFLAAHLYAGAQWPIFENTPDNILLNDKKNDCYAKYIKFADHEIRRVEVPFGGGGKRCPDICICRQTSRGACPACGLFPAWTATKRAEPPFTATRCASGASQRWPSKDPARTNAPFAKFT